MLHVTLNYFFPTPLCNRGWPRFLKNVSVHLLPFSSYPPPQPQYVSGRHFFEARGSVKYGGR